MKAFALIPARGGSKGLPRKNVLPLCGKPLLAWAIEAASLAEVVDRVIVSTDDPEIGAVAERFGAGVVWRPPAISGDRASSEEALLHVLDSLREQGETLPEVIAFVQCTSPLTLSADIDATCRRVLEEDADTAFTASPHFHFLWREDPAHGALGVNHDKRRRLMRQQREPEFLENGAVYAMRTEGFREHRHRFFGRTVIQEMPPERTLEIDSLLDFEIAEVLLRQRMHLARADLIPAQVRTIVFDFDGVFTDNKVHVTDERTEAVTCNRSDGMGVAMLRRAGYRMLVLSTEEHPVVSGRCRKLQLACLQGIADKRAALEAWAAEKGVDLASTIYVGNDINDAGCLRAVGFPVTVADAYPEAKRLSLLVLQNEGGRGAVRELADLLLAGKVTAP